MPKGAEKKLMNATRQDTDMKFYNKRGLSELVTSILMIALVMSLGVIIWTVSKNLVSEKLDKSSSCFGNFNEITIGKQYSCVNFTSNETKVSLNVGNIDIEGILVSISGNSGAKSFIIKANSSFSYVKMYNGAYGASLSLPGKNSGLTYVVSNINIGVSDADSVAIAPIISGNQCEVSDSINELGSC